MARQRMIKPEFFTDDHIGLMEHVDRLLFIGLWTLADKRGRLRDQPPVIHGALFPFEPEVDVDLGLTRLSNCFIRRYKVNGHPYIQIVNFEKHQHPHPKEAESLIPPPPADNGSAVESNGSAVEKCSPSPSESYSNSKSESDIRQSGKPNPLLKRVDAEREALRITALIATAENRDGTEVAIEATSYERQGQTVKGKPRYDTLSDDRLAHALSWLRARVRQHEAPPVPRGEDPLVKIRRIEAAREVRMRGGAA